jgi:hypothetical protein
MKRYSMGAIVNISGKHKPKRGEPLVEFIQDECSAGEWVRFEDAQAEIERLKAQSAAPIAEMSEALGDETLNSLSQVATGIRDLQAEIDALKQQNEALLAKDKQLKHLADPAREWDIQELCAGLVAGCEEYIWGHDWARNKHRCTLCHQEYNIEPKHKNDCVVLIAQGLMTNAKARGDQV